MDCCSGSSSGPVICAEGYLFELERRGYLQAGAFVPEVVLEHPELVSQLHREFVHAGSDVVQAFTYYAHREKMAMIGKEHLLEEINRQALRIAKEVADESGSLLAGDICNTNVFLGDESRNAVRAMFEEQVAWAVEAGVDYVVAETFTWGGEALVGLETIKAAGLPAVVTLAIHRDGTTAEGWSPEEACKRFEAAGADVVGLNCTRGPKTMLPLIERVRAAVDCHVAALPVPYRTTEAEPTFQSLRDPGCDVIPERAPFPHGARSLRLQPLRAGGLRADGERSRSPLPRRLLRRRPASHPRSRGRCRSHAACEPVLAGHVEARVLRDGRTSAGGV